MLATLAALLAAATLSYECPPPPLAIGELPPASLSARLAGPKPAFLEEAPEGEARWRRLQALYAVRDHRPLWPGREGALAHLFAEICASKDAGLALAHYLGASSGVAQVAFLPDAPGGARAEAFEAARHEAAVLEELRLTDALITFGLHKTQGRVRPTRWQVTGPRVDEATLVAWLATALESPNPALALAGLSPRNPAYRRTVAALADHRRIAAEGGWPTVPGEGVLRRGHRSAQVVTLRKRLTLSGDLAATPAPDPRHFDEAVEAAVRRFQARHGLEADGVVGHETRDALSVPVEVRIRQLRLNLERMRWIHDAELGRRHVLVNVPAYELYLVVEGRTVATMRAVVGSPQHQTPTFSDRITYLEVNPTWWVPQSIIEARIIPRASRDPSWLGRMGFELRRDGRSIDPEDVDWARARREGELPYAVRQRPGPGNAMGQVKFMFPNRHLVYLHDTPDIGRFAEARRAFSFGCVRVEEPEVLMRFLLEEWPEAEAAAFSALDGAGRRTPERVDLDEPVPVHLVYFTAWVDEGGAVHFREDVYGRDRWLGRHLDREWPGWD